MAVRFRRALHAAAAVPHTELDGRITTRGQPDSRHGPRSDRKTRDVSVLSSRPQMAPQRLPGDHIDNRFSFPPVSAAVILACLPVCRLCPCILVIEASVSLVSVMVILACLSVVSDW